MTLKRRFEFLISAGAYLWIEVFVGESSELTDLVVAVTGNKAFDNHHQNMANRHRMTRESYPRSSMRSQMGLRHQS